MSGHAGENSGGIGSQSGSSGGGISVESGTRSLPSPRWLGKRVGRFKLLAILGQGAMGRVFGVCANEYAPDDGRVVALDHGCGAHSEVVVPGAGLAERPDPVIDELEYDAVEPGTSGDRPTDPPSGTNSTRASVN